MRLSRILLLLVITGGLGAAVVAMRGTSQPAEGQPVSLEAGLESRMPGLMASIDETAQRWNQIMPHRPMRYIRIVEPRQEPELAAWLDLWVLSRLYCEPGEDDRAYRFGTFSQPTVDQLPPRAYIIASIGGRESVVLFTRSDPASPLPSDSPHGWNRGTLCPLDVAMELGSALKLIEDFMVSASENRQLAPFCETLKGKWGKDAPARWALLQQIDQDRIASGLFQMEADLNVHDAANFSLWVDTVSGRRLGLEMVLVRQSGREGYMGWRIRTIAKVDTPQPPEAGY
ncbi:MAG: hypothetical protein ACLFUJ_08605 [Phycisphaerae bacterium]